MFTSEPERKSAASVSDGKERKTSITRSRVLRINLFAMGTSKLLVGLFSGERASPFPFLALEGVLKRGLVTHCGLRDIRKIDSIVIIPCSPSRIFLRLVSVLFCWRIVTEPDDSGEMLNP